MKKEKEKQLDKGVQDKSRQFPKSKGENQMFSEDMRNCLISLIITEMQIKTTVKYHYTPSNNKNI